MVREHLNAFLEHLRLNENASVAHGARATRAIFPSTCRFLPTHLHRRQADLAIADLDHT